MRLSLMPAPESLDQPGPDDQNRHQIFLLQLVAAEHLHSIGRR
jgi:hypothetical protein